jgi:ribosomal protein S18 acetylase RimI-like enzyme
MLSLRPLTLADVEAVGPWFDEGETRRWLGNRSWVAQCLRLTGPDRHALLGTLDDMPVGLVDVEVVGPRAGFAIVIAPSHRRRGIGAALIEACVADPRFAGVDEWFAGVEHSNGASRALLERRGFSRMTDEDAEGFTYFALRRRGWPDLPWRPYDMPRVRPSTLRKQRVGEPD